MSAKRHTFIEGALALASLALSVLYLVNAQWGFGAVWLVMALVHWTLASFWFIQHEQDQELP